MSIIVMFMMLIYLETISIYKGQKDFLHGESIYSFPVTFISF